MLAAGVGMMALGLGSVVYWQRRTHVAWRFALVGGVAWWLAILLKVAAARSLEPLSEWLRRMLPGFVAEPMVWLSIGLLTGVFECGVTLLAAQFLCRRRPLKWREAAAFGIGFGAMEAVVLALETLAQESSAAKLASVAFSLEALTDLIVPILERFSALGIHLYASLIIVYAVQQRAWRWFWCSFFYKTLTDGLPVELLLPYGIWLIESLYLILGLYGFRETGRFRLRWNASDQPPGSAADE